MEDVQYALTAASQQFDVEQDPTALDTIWLRMETGVVFHVLISAVFGSGLIWFLGTLGISSTATSIGYRFLVGIVGIAMVVAVYHRVVPRERDIVRAVLAPEVASGALEQDELDPLAGDGVARRQFRRNASGTDDRRRRDHRLPAADDLADELARAHGEDTPRVLHARTELARFVPDGDRLRRAVRVLQPHVGDGR